MSSWLFWLSNSVIIFYDYFALCRNNLYCCSLVQGYMMKDCSFSIETNDWMRWLIYDGKARNSIGLGVPQMEADIHIIPWKGKKWGFTDTSATSGRYFRWEKSSFTNLKANRRTKLNSMKLFGILFSLDSFPALSFNWMVIFLMVWAYGSIE